VNTLQILYLEDDRNDVELAGSTLSNSGLVFEIAHVKDRESYIQALEKKDFDIILIDFKLPSFDGLSALRIAKEKCADVPLIILSGTVNEVEALEIINEGAADYVLKDSLPRLPFSIRRAVREKKEIDELRGMKETLRKSEEKFRGVVENIGIGVSLISQNMEILFLNKQMKEWFPDIDITMNPLCYQAFNKPPKDGPCSYCPTCLTLRDGQIHKAVTETPVDGRIVNYRIVSSPVKDEQGIISSAIEMVEDITAAKEREKRLMESRDAFLNMLKETDAAYKDLQQLHESIIRSFVNAIDAKSPWTRGHSERVMRYALSIAREMGLTQKDIGTLKIAALLHDIGKIGTYDALLDKPGRLTEEEFALVKLHPAKGAEILQPIRQISDIVPIIRHHHERIDGKGYPDELKGDEIPLPARILHVADSYDSMTADRPYRPSPGKEYAISELRKYSGVQFDAKVVRAFLSILGVNGDTETLG
jgi:putative nucleotidyltransferase with HDIG domain